MKGDIYKITLMSECKMDKTIYLLLYSMTVSIVSLQQLENTPPLTTYIYVYL